MRGQCRARVAAVVLAAFVTSCATTQVPPIGAGGKPFGLERDEKRLWERSEQEEAKLNASGRILEDPLLEDYLTGLVEKLAPPEVRNEHTLAFRVKVIKDPSLNAFAYPNGTIYVHTGLLARVRNEAQLATVLGHEMTHVTNRHALRFLRDAQNKALALTLLGVGASIGIAAIGGNQARQGHVVTASVLSQTANVMLGLGLQLGLLAAVNGYGRGLEAEADAGGLERLVAAGYDPKEAPKVFEILMRDHGDSTKVENFFFGNHPRLTDRIQTTTELLQTRYPDAARDPARTRNTDEFERRVRPVVRENAYLDLQAGRYNLARDQLDHVLRVAPNDPIAHYYLGELYRAEGRRNQGDLLALARAEEEYRKALDLDPKYPEPYRQLGFLAYGRKDREQARESFRRYLELKPEAKDARQIREYLIELGG